MRRTIHLSTALLLIIGTVDLATTLVFLRLGMRESNPIFGRILDQGVVPFVAAKVLFLAVPILLLEIVRQTRPKSAEQGTWIAVIAYLVLYGGHLAALPR